MKFIKAKTASVGKIRDNLHPFKNQKAAKIFRSFFRFSPDFLRSVKAKTAAASNKY